MPRAPPHAPWRQECIEKYLRLGQKECPKCRVKVSSRRALRPDPKFDRLVRAFYPDIDDFEAKEEAFISLVSRNPPPDPPTPPLAARDPLADARVPCVLHERLGGLMRTRHIS